MVSENKELLIQFDRIFRTNYPKIKLLRSFDLSSTEDAILMDEELFLFTIIDLNLEKIKPDNIYKLVTDLRENTPVLFWGKENLFNTLVPKNFFESHRANNAIYEPINVTELRKAVTTCLMFAENDMIEEATISVDLNLYLPVKIKNFYRFNKLSYDVYVE